jgi:transposase-like protein
MPLSPALSDALMTHLCPRCGHKLERKGSYFRTITHYRCGSCQHKVGVSYEDKLKLFDAHSHLAGG